MRVYRRDSMHNMHRMHLGAGWRGPCQRIKDNKGRRSVDLVQSMSGQARPPAVAPAQNARFFCCPAVFRLLPRSALGSLWRRRHGRSLGTEIEENKRRQKFSGFLGASGADRHGLYRARETRDSLTCGFQQPGTGSPYRTFLQDL